MKIEDIIEDHEKRIKNLEERIKDQNINKLMEPKNRKSGSAERIEELLKLKTSGFFKIPRNPQIIKTELIKLGKKRLCKNIEVYLLILVDRGELKREKTRNKEERKTWTYYS